MQKSKSMLKVSQGGLGAETYAGLAIETDPYNNDATNRFTFEIDLITVFINSIVNNTIRMCN